MVAVLRQAGQSNFTNFGVSFYLQGMQYMKANNASSEFSTSSMVTQRDLASQYLSQVLVDTNVLNQGVTASTQRLISAYNSGAVSPLCKNSSSRPALCFLLSEPKTDAEFVHQLSTVKASLKVWSYIIIQSGTVASGMPKPYSDLPTRYGNPWHNNIHCYT